MARRSRTRPRPTVPPPPGVQPVSALTFGYFPNTVVADPPPIPAQTSLNPMTDDPKVTMANADMDPLTAAANPPPDGATAAFLRDLFAPRNFWASPTAFNDCTSPYHKFMLMALALKASTSTNEAGLTTMQTALGASDVVRVTELSPQAPDGLRISLPGYTIFCIHGATRLEQLSYLRDRNAEKLWYANGTGFTETPMTAPTGGSNAIVKAFTEIGAIYEPFVHSAQMWINYIRTWWATSGTQKIVLVGHSLGAAVVELIAAYMSVWWHNVRAAASTRYDLSSVSPLLGSTPTYLPLVDALGAAWGTTRGYPQVDHGIVFGQPNTMFEQRYLLETARNPDYLAGMSRMPSQIMRQDHPLDPVTKIPANATIWEDAFRFFPQRREPAKYTSQFPLRRQHVQPGWIGKNANLINLPRNNAIFVERINTYHGIQNYVDQVKAGLVDTYGPPSETWETLIASISGLTGSNNSNWA